MTSETKGCLFLTAAKGIQSYIMATDKLRDMVGGSEIVAQLPTQVLDTAIKKLKDAGVIKENGTPLIQAAGNATVFFAIREDAEKLAEVWPLVASLYAPGLEVVQAVVDCSPAKIFQQVAEGEKRLMHGRQTPNSALPEAGPLVERNKRSGFPATEYSKYGEPVDAGLARKLVLAPSAQKTMIRNIIPERLGNEEDLLERFPINFNQIVTDDNSYLAVIHIDVNGLGQLRMNLGNNQPEDGDQRQTLIDFSTAVQDSNLSAMRLALAPLMQRESNPSAENPYPFRPIVCSGDDVTMVLRATDAMEFTRIFLETFEKESAQRVVALGLDHGASLTACAGVAFVKKNFPFALAYQLCESLCTHAKEVTMRESSAVAFHRVSTSNATTYGHILKQELTVAGGLLTMNPYVVGGNPSAAGDLPRLCELEDLVAVVAKLPKSAVRNVIKELYRDYERSKKAFDRLRDIQKEKKKPVYDKLLLALQALTRKTDQNDLLWREPDKLKEIPHRTPLYDAMELLAVGTRGGDDNTNGSQGDTL